MANGELVRELAQRNPSRIIMVVLDGLGGLPHPDTGLTELETASTPNLDRLAGRATCGLLEPVSPGITPGSGPSHLALFGYDPLKNNIGRGVLEALGVDFPLQAGDLAFRGNFCTVDEKGAVIDRRAGRIPTAASAQLCKLLQERITLPQVELFVVPVKDHRFAVIFRGKGLSPQVAETDPQQLGVPPREPLPLSPEGKRTAELVRKFLNQARAFLDGKKPANMVLSRGYSLLPHLPPFPEVYKLRPAAIASYPMYRGLARVLGMEVLPGGASFSEGVQTLARHYQEYDFFYLHLKETDAAGEDGDFPRKVKAIEEADASLLRLVELKPEVLIVTGDHSTPALLKGHSWHPVPFMLSSPLARSDGLSAFSERECAQGSLGRFPATQVMPLAMAHALKLTKFGA